MRNYGSGNAGLTNFYRAFGVVGMALVVGIDVIKSVVAIIVGSLLLGIVDEPLMGMIFAGFCLALGHSYPVFHALRGGKGVLCTGVLVLMADWRVGILCWLVFVAVVVFSRYVSLGSIIGSAVFPVGTWILGHGWLQGLIALFVCLIIVFTHHQNIARLLAGQENKFELRPGAGYR